MARARVVRARHPRRSSSGLDVSRAPPAAADADSGAAGSRQRDALDGDEGERRSLEIHRLSAEPGSHRASGDIRSVGRSMRRYAVHIPGAADRDGLREGPRPRGLGVFWGTHQEKGTRPRLAGGRARSRRGRGRDRESAPAAIRVLSLSSETGDEDQPSKRKPGWPMAAARRSTPASNSSWWTLRWVPSG